MPIYATTDIGSNTLHLLVAKTSSHGLLHLTSQNNWLSLGGIVSKKGYLPSSLIDEIVRTLGIFKKEAINAGAESIYIFATEAIRLADNHRELVNKIYKELKVNISIINPTQEAEFSWKGCLLDSNIESPALFIEVGGGSIQIAVAKDQGLHSICSLPLGTGKLIACSHLTQPSTSHQLEYIKQYIQKHLQNCNIANSINNVVASGGVARALVRAIHPDRDPKISLEEIDYLVWSASRLTLKQISKRFNIKSKRAASLLPGSLLFSLLLRYFNQKEITVSEYGVREGAILSLAEGKVTACPL